ncbi:MAG TPA: hypothetical protein VF710_09130 [Longimicrobium sp.]|jgi:hypothetical protein
MYAGFLRATRVHRLFGLPRENPLLRDKLDLLIKFFFFEETTK